MYFDRVLLHSNWDPCLITKGFIYNFEQHEELIFFRIKNRIRKLIQLNHGYYLWQGYIG